MFLKEKWWQNIFLTFLFTFHTLTRYIFYAELVNIYFLEVVIMATGTCQITISASEASIATYIDDEKFIRKIPFDFKTSPFSPQLWFIF